MICFRRLGRRPARAAGLLAALALSACASIAPEEEVIITGGESAKGVTRFAPRFVPTVYIDETAASACSADNQNPTAGPGDGYTCLEILFGTNRALSRKGEAALAGSAASPEDPKDYFEDARFSETALAGDPGYFRARDPQTGFALPYESYRAGRIIVTVPKRAPGDAIEAYEYSSGPFGWTSRSPNDQDRRRYFTTWTYKLMSQRDFWTRAQTLLELGDQLGNPDWTSDSRAVLVFVHGFNVSFAAAAYRISQIVYDLRFAGVPFMFSWPANSQGDPLRYFNDTSQAAAAVGDLKLFLLDIKKKLNPSKFIIIAHSHGNQLLLRTLDEIEAERDADDPVFDAIIFASPDVDAFEFRRLVERTKKIAPSKTLYASSDDKANLGRQILNGLRLSWFRAIKIMPRAGYVERGGAPVIGAGLQSIDLTGATVGRLGPEEETERDRGRPPRDALLHDQYATASDIISDIRALIDTVGEGVPPHCRTPKLVLRSDGASGSYWRYSAAGAEPAGCPGE